MLLAERFSVPSCTSFSLDHFTGTNTLPQVPRREPVIIAQEIKHGPTLPPGVTEPARPPRPTRLVHPKGRLPITALAVMLAKGATAHATAIQGHIAPDQRVRVLRGAPLGNRRRGEAP